MEQIKGYSAVRRLRKRQDLLVCTMLMCTVPVAGKACESQHANCFAPGASPVMAAWGGIKVRQHVNCFAQGASPVMAVKGAGYKACASNGLASNGCTGGGVHGGGLWDMSGRARSGRHRTNGRPARVRRLRESAACAADSRESRNCATRARFPAHKSGRLK